MSWQYSVEHGLQLDDEGERMLQLPPLCTPSLFYPKSLHVHDDDVDEFNRTFQEALASGDTWDHQFRIVADDIRHIRIFSESNRNHGMRGGMVDMTEEVRGQRLTGRDATDLLRELRQEQVTEVALAAKEATRLQTWQEEDARRAIREADRLSSNRDAAVKGASDEAHRLHVVFEAACVASDAEASRLTNLYRDDAANADEEATRLSLRREESIAEARKEATRLHDVFKKKEARAIAEIERLERRHESDAQSQSDMNSMIRTICHEIRNPLQGIISNCEFLMAWMAGDTFFQDRERGAGCVRDILTCATYQSQVLDQLLNFESMRLGAKPAKDALARGASVDAIVSRVVSMFSETCADRGVQLVAEPSRVRGDFYASAVQTVLVNVIGNAAKFTREGRIDVVASLCDAARVTIEVSDTGPGIDPTVQERLFKSYGVKSSNMTVPGAGLGLRICALLLQGMNGSIDFETSDRGSRLIIQFPVADAVYSSSISSQSSRDALDDFVEDVRLLIVDDNYMIRDLYAKMLADEFRCDTARDGVEACAKFASAVEANDAYDLIMLDVVMPNMNGIDCAARIRESSAVPIVFVTGEIGSELRRIVDEGDAFHLLLKPARKGAIVNLLRSLL